MTQRKMKDSGIEWIGEIPEEWEIGKIRYYFTIICGATPKSDELKYWNGNINWITPAEMSESNKIITESIRKITAAGYQSCGTELIPKNSLILSTRAPIGQVCISGCELCTNQGCKSLKIRTANTNYEYYYYYLTIQSAIFNMLGRGTTFMELSTTDLSDYIIPVPSIGEQQTIADYLDKKCAAIDKAIEAEKQIIEKLKIYKQSVITDAVTKGLDKNAKMKPSGIDWIGEIPGNTTVTRAGLLYTSILGQMVNDHPNNDDDTLEDYICALNVHFDGIDCNVIKQMYFDEGSKKRYLLQNGDLLVVEGGAGAGGAYIIDGLTAGQKLYIQNSIHRVRPVSNEVTNKFLYYTLYSLATRNYIDFVCNTATIPHFTKEKLSDVPIVLFPRDEQQKITDYLDKKCGTIDKAVETRNVLIAKLKIYKKSLIYECVTGKRMGRL